MNPAYLFARTRPEWRDVRVACFEKYGTLYGPKFDEFFSASIRADIANDMGLEEPTEDVSAAYDDREPQLDWDDEGEEATLDVIGQKMGIGKERVRQIQEKALRKLRFIFWQVLSENSIGHCGREWSITASGLLYCAGCGQPFPRSKRDPRQL